MKKKFSKEVAFTLAMCINSISLSLLVKSDFGIATLSSLPKVLNTIVPDISFGMMNFIVQSVVLCIVMMITKQPKASYTISFLVGFVFGVMVDGADSVIMFLPDALTFKLFYFALGWIAICCGATLFILSAMPLMPFDVVVKDLALFTGKPVRWVKTVCDLIMVLSSLSLTFVFLQRLVGVGIGTIFMMAFNGWLMGKYMDWFTQRYDFVCATRFGQTMNDLAAIRPKDE
ncbi:DUF6198 family protein [Peptoniphilus equinus]|uniref:DUF6198 family protein n=1 Tax=Peptoniphilus equinus TaxID=3016343 RepID=A0ABY7QU09_9FIRM|nr:DUF6198 family protein [Peptoniphilus equinus]WBW49378.1 DUF6198 family protein [Peptoniphilus equinus]